MHRRGDDARARERERDRVVEVGGGVYRAVAEEGGVLDVPARDGGGVAFEGDERAEEGQCEGEVVGEVERLVDLGLLCCSGVGVVADYVEERLEGCIPRKRLKWGEEWPRPANLPGAFGAAHSDLVPGRK